MEGWMYNKMMDKCKQNKYKLNIYVISWKIKLHSISIIHYETPFLLLTHDEHMVELGSDIKFMVPHPDPPQYLLHRLIPLSAVQSAL